MVAEKWRKLKEKTFLSTVKNKMLLHRCVKQFVILKKKFNKTSKQKIDFFATLASDARLACEVAHSRKIP